MAKHTRRTDRAKKSDGQETVDHVHVIRHKVLVEGRSQRRVAKELAISRTTVRKYVEQAAPVRTAARSKERLEDLPLSVGEVHVVEYDGPPLFVHQPDFGFMR